MKLKTEAVVFLLFAAWVGTNLGGSGEGDTSSRRRRSGGSSEREYLSTRVPDLLGSRVTLLTFNYFKRDVRLEFLVDAFLQRKNRQLQDLHGLDHPGAQLHLL